MPINSETLKIPVYLKGLPLSLKANLIVLFFSTIPYLIFFWIFKGTWLSTSFLVGASLATFGALRYRYAVDEHPEKLWITYSQGVFYFPGALFSDKQDQNITLTEITRMLVYQFYNSKPVYPTGLAFIQQGKNTITVSAFQTDIKRILGIIQSDFPHERIDYKIDPLRKWIILMTLWTIADLIVLAAVYWWWS